MRLLLDTHVMMWMVKDPGRLPRPIHDIVEDTRNQLLLSIASPGEVSIKRARGRLRFADIDQEFLDRYHPTLAPIELRHVAAIASLPPHHADPFDRMLVAQASTGRLSLITEVEQLAAYDVDILW